MMKLSPLQSAPLQFPTTIFCMMYITHFQLGAQGLHETWHSWERSHPLPCAILAMNLSSQAVQPGPRHASIPQQQPKHRWLLTVWAETRTQGNHSAVLTQATTNIAYTQSCEQQKICIYAFHFNTGI